jgi:hypothetical protein
MMQLTASRLLLVLAGTLASLQGTAVIPGTTTQNNVFFPFLRYYYCPKNEYFFRKSFVVTSADLCYSGEFTEKA